MEHHGTYIGPREDLVGATALIRPDPDGGWLAQFDAADDTSLCFDWHHFPLEHFHIDYTFGASPEKEEQ